MGIRAIARYMGVARNTVREAIRSDGPPNYERERRGSIVDAERTDALALVPCVWGGHLGSHRGATRP